MDLAKFLLELLIGAVLFLPKQEKHPHFWPRFLLGSVLAYVVCAANDAVLNLLELSGSDGVVRVKFMRKKSVMWS